MPLLVPVSTRVDHRYDFRLGFRPNITEAYGTCIKCGAKKQDLGNGLCLQCYDAAGAMMQTYYRRKSQGLCVQCGIAPVDGHVRCSKCLLAMSAWNSLWRRRKRQRAGIAGGMSSEDLVSLEGHPEE